VTLWRRLAFGALAACAIAGCGGSGTADRAADKAKPKKEARPAAAAEATPAATPVAYHYDPTGKPDPFRSFVNSLKRADVTAASTPLERFDLSQLKLTGIVWDNDKPRALVNDPSGKAYIVAEGTAIGKNGGRVIRIGDNALVVKETYVDFLGKATTKDIEMRLHERQGG
jgi:type IV pilus assembly protein PilP